MKTTASEKKRFDYRHIICIVITLGCIACSVFRFPNAFGRLFESGRDFGLSAGYYFCELAGIEHNITPTVNDLPKTPFFDFVESLPPQTTLPDSFEGFKSDWVLYWQLWVTKGNLLGYLSFLGNLLYNLAYGILIALPFIVFFAVLFRNYLNKVNNDCDKESLPLRFFKRITYRIYYPAKLWVIRFIAFLRDNKGYLTAWLWIWLFNFNVLTIIIEFFAFYFYFAVSYELSSLYLQVYKLMLDLWAIFDFMPFWVWFIVAFLVLYIFSLNQAYSTLYHRERCNRGFINERGVVTVVYGEMGAGKTALLTDIALSKEVQFRDDALEIILECDMKFPNFPWTKFEHILKLAFEQHKIYDSWSCRRFIRRRHRKFNRNQCSSQIYGYDFEHYGLVYDDKLKLVDIWEVLEDYACAYLVYTIQSSLIVSNYSIRVDSLMLDLGNFPLWNADFFKRDSRLIDSFSRHSHILDFDMLRLGKKMLKENPNRNAYGFGIYVVTEIDKERKNTLELKEVKATSKECNQKNDLFNIIVKMSRHACVIANRVFVAFIADLQRPESLGSDTRELGEVVYIKSQSETSPVLPFYSPFWLFELIYLGLKNLFNSFYLQYKYLREDNTLLLFIIKNIMAIMAHYFERINNLFGSATLGLEVESGRLNGVAKTRKYYRQSKKIWAKRYATDCLSGIFEVRGELNEVGINDLREYADIVATNDELLYQESHFQKEVQSFSGLV